jgi:hypothetical protein
MPLTFTCPGCQKQLRAKDELAGRKTQCPGCGRVCRIPGGDEVTTRPAAAASRPRPAAPVVEDEDALEEAPPAPRAKRRPTVEDEERPTRPSKRRPGEEDDADEEERPARRLKKKRRQKSRTGLYLLVGGVALVCLLLCSGAGAGFAWWWFNRPSPWNMDRAQQYLPDNCTLLVSIRWDEMQNSRAFQDLKNAIPNINGFQQPSGFTSLQSAGIEQMVVGAGPEVKNDALVVIRTRKKVTVADLKTGTGASTYTQSTVGRYTVYTSATDAFCVIDPLTTVVGEPATVKRVLSRNQKATLSAGLQQAMQHADFGKHIAFALGIKELAQNQQGLLPANPFMGPRNNTPVPQGMAGQATFDADTHLAITLLCQDAKAAEDTRKQLDTGVKALKLFPGLPRELSQILDGLKVSVAGSNLNGDLTVRTSTLLTLLRQLERNQRPVFPGQPRR